MNKLAIVAAAACVMLASPALAMDLPTLPGSYAIAGHGGGALVISKTTEGANMDVVVKNLMGGDGGNALAVGIGKNLIVFGQGGTGGVGGIDARGADSSKMKISAGNIGGGWGGNATTILGADKLEIKIQGFASGVLK